MRPPESISQLFRRRGWRVARFQREAWQAYLSGKSGLIHAPTGSGKSLAAWLGPIIEALKAPTSAEKGPPPLTTVWITPLRALAQDTARGLLDSAEDLGLAWTVELRTGDTPSPLRQRQKKRLPTCLVTTPESLSLLLSYQDIQRQLASVRCVVVDEWHELLGSKRGVQLELCLARLKTLQPRLRLWGLSATIGNLEQAQSVLLGKSEPGTLIVSEQRKSYRIRALIPPQIDRFPWAGHLGITLLPQVIDAVRSAASTLIFTNTRSQAEIWHERLRQACPDWKDEIALHHASLSHEYRQEVEAGLKSGRLRCVICTSSLDLGVDFAPVEQIMQVGSPKGIARLIQRAGRSGHQPGATSAVTCIPTHAFELVEICAARRGFEEGELEARRPLELCLDVLAQHCVTLALGGGFRPQDLYAEVTQTYAFRRLSQMQWQWTLDFIARGGSALQAYPQFQRVIEQNGVYRVESKTIAQRHRMSIGTINSDSAMQLRFLKGGYLGTIEEAFMGKLAKGDAFLFNGKLLELVLTRDMTAFVRLARTRTRVVPRWQGGRIPLSTLLAGGVRKLLDPNSESLGSPEMECLEPILAIQRRWSKLPIEEELLVEQTRTRDGFHTFVFPFAGRAAHEGMANLMASRLSAARPSSFHMVTNDYGFALCCPEPITLDESTVIALLSPNDWELDLLRGINQTELSLRRFRDIARIAGLVFPGWPGRSKSVRQLQVSSGLLFEVLRKYDAENLLLRQSLEEVLHHQIEYARIAQALSRLQGQRVCLCRTERLSPMAFPLWAEGLRPQTLSSEKWEDRVRRMASQLSAKAAAPQPLPT